MITLGSLPVPDVVNSVSRAVESFFGAGASLIITSGRRGAGLPQANNRSGRHGTGYAIDFEIRRPDGSMVVSNSPEGQAFFVHAFGTGDFIGGGFAYEGMGEHSFDLMHIGGTDAAYGGQVPELADLHYPAANAIADQVNSAYRQSRGDLTEAGPTRASAE